MINVPKTILRIICSLLLASAPLFAEQPVIHAPATEMFKLHDHYTGVSDGGLFTSDIPPHSETWHVTVNEVPELHWHVVVGAKNEEPIAQGDIVNFRLQLRSQVEGQRALAQLCIQDHWDNYSNIATLDTGAGNSFEEVELQFEAESDYSPDQIGFAVFLGQQAQSVEIAKIEVTKATTAGTGSSPRPETFTFTFDGEFQTPQMTKGDKSNITGKVPIPFVEDSSWADVDVNYRNAEGIWRIEVDAIRSGFAQQLLERIPTTHDYYTRIKVEAKSPTQTQFEVMLRNSSNYSSYWRDVVTPSPEWREFEFLVPPLENNPSAELALAYRSAGVVDLRAVKVEYVTAAELGLNQAIEGNLLPNSSLPFGIVAPWHGYANFAQEWHQDADPVVIGPTGVPAFKLDGYDNEQHLNTAFNGQPGATHTLSFWAKASRNDTQLAMRMGPPAEQLWVGDWNKNLRVSTEWKRYSHTVHLPFNAEGFYLVQLRMWTDADIWVDGFMVEASPRLSDFKRVAPVELSISPVSEVEPYAIYFPDQTMAVRVNGLGEAPSGSVIRTSVGEFRSHERIQIKDTPINSGELSETIVEIECCELPELGSYRVEIQIVDPEGNIISPIKDILLHRIREPRMLGQFAEDSPFAAHASADFRQAPAMKAIGVNWLRSFKFGWSRFWRGGPDGHWDFSEGDGRVEAYASNHIYIQTPLSHPPRWATDAPPDIRHFRITQFVPSDQYLDRWADYAHTLASRYAGKIHAYESWNEPFFRTFMIGGVDENGDWVQATPEKFVAMTQASYHAIRDADPSAKHIWNVGGKNEPWFDNAVGALDIWGYFDVASYHNYTTNLGGFPGDSFQQGAQAAFDVFERHGSDTVEMWNTEGGPGGSHFHFFSPHGPARDMSSVEDLTSTYIARSYVSMLAAGVKKYFIYYFSYGFWTGNYALNQPSGQFAPNAVAYSNLAWHIEGKEYVKTVALLDGAWHAFIFEDDNESSALLVPRQAVVYAIPNHPDLQAHGLYGNPISNGTERRTDTWFIGKSLTGEQLAEVLASALND